MRNKGDSSSISSTTRTQPHFLMGLLGREADTFADAYLVSQEGELLPVVRSLLAMKCNFFKQKFFPESMEGSILSDGNIDSKTSASPTEDKKTLSVFASIGRTSTAPAYHVDQKEEFVAESQAGSSILDTGGELASNTGPSAARRDAGVSSTGEKDGTLERRFLSESHIYGESGPFMASKGNSKPRYPMSFPMILLRQVVEFTYTDSVVFLDEIEAKTSWRTAPNASFSPQTQPCAVASHIVELARAAANMQLQDLCRRCCNILQIIVRVKRSTACAALGAIRRKKNNPIILDKMANLLVRNINGDVKKSFCIVPCNKSNPKGQETSCECFGAFEKCTVMHLDSEVLEEIIRAQASGFSDEYMLQVVYFWASGGKRLLSAHTSSRKTIVDDTSATVDIDTTGVFENVDSEQFIDASDVPPLTDFRKEVDPTPVEGIVSRETCLVCPNTGTPNSDARFAEGKAMISKFDLTEMNPSFLHEFVESSGLVDGETLYNVYRSRALSANRFSRIFTFKKWNCPPRCDPASTKGK